MGGPAISNPHQRAPMMSNYISTSNGASPPPPSATSHSQWERNRSEFPTDQRQLPFSSSNLFTFLFLLLFSQPIRTRWRHSIKWSIWCATLRMTAWNVSISDDSGMGSILDTESSISLGGPSSSSTGLFASPRGMPMDLNKEERFSRKVFVGGLPPDIDEEEIIAPFSTLRPVDRRLAAQAGEQVVFSHRKAMLFSSSPTNDPCKNWSMNAWSMIRNFTCASQVPAWKIKRYKYVLGYWPIPISSWTVLSHSIRARRSSSAEFHGRYVQSN